MKKVMSLIAMFAMGAMLAGCYSKACEEPQPAPAPYKDMAPAATTPAEEAKPMHHKKHHHKKHHHKMKHKAMKKAEESTMQEAAPAQTPAQDNAAEPAAQQ